ncbi:MAG: YhdH/YhfP family quinone oxidoreductase [Paludibacter sp.]|nr:YhdH/YhfP family quinone oxidoreductase [Paludibacter sp.]
MIYKAIVVEEIEGKYLSSLKNLDTENLPQGEVLIRVQYSSLNYKDALSAIGNKGVTKNYPHTPGIDAAGIVEASDVPEFVKGEEVIVTGYDLGMNTAGGFGQYIRVPASWVVKLPQELSPKEAMIIGTAGFTAGISVARLSELVSPGAGRIVVSGATGGVGSVALSLLAKLGYTTVAVSGKATEHDFLKSLGVSEVVSREEFAAEDKRPVLSARFAGGIDTVGGPILEKIVKSVGPLGAITTCGSVSATQLNMSVFPFILRGISLIGISAQNYPMHLREVLWQRLASEWKPNHLLSLYNEIELEQVNDAIALILKGKLKGRTIIRL